MNRALVAFSFLVNFLWLNLFLSLLCFGLFLACHHLRCTRIPRVRAHLLLYALVLPPLLAYVIPAASLIPPFLALEDHGVHLSLSLAHPYHHLCFFDSPRSLPSSPIFRGLLATSLALILFSLLRLGYAYWRTRGYLGWLTKHRTVLQEDGLPHESLALPEQLQREGGLHLHLVSASFPVSFLSGIFHPHLILSTGLLQTLLPGQLQALLQHEVAHRLRRDNLTQLVLAFCKNLLFFSPTGHLLFRWWKQEAELLCDEMAIYRTKRPLDLAEALLKLQKATLSLPPSFLRAATIRSSFLRFASSSFLERRLRNILRFCDCGLLDALPPKAPSSSGPLRELIALGALAFLLLSLINALLGPLFLHCQLERIVRFLI